MHNRSSSKILIKISRRKINQNIQYISALFVKYQMIIRKILQKNVEMILLLRSFKFSINLNKKHQIVKFSEEIQQMLTY